MASTDLPSAASPPDSPDPLTAGQDRLTLPALLTIGHKAPSLDSTNVTELPQSTTSQAVDSASTAPEVVEDQPVHCPSAACHHRSLSPPLSQASTSLVSTWLSSPAFTEQEKEVAHSYPYSSTELAARTNGLWSEKRENAPCLSTGQSEEQPTICGIKARTFWITSGVVLAILILLGVGLGAGLGIGLTSGDKNHAATSSADPRFALGGAINPAYYSTSGAFNGSGIGFAGAAMKSTEKGEYSIYYQHHSGQIRYVQLDSNNKFLGGTSSEIVASDARNATRLSVVQYVLDAVSIWHVFYVGQDGFLKERIWTNESSIW